MAPGNFEHIDVGPTLSRVEWELGTVHHLAAQAIGDLVIATSAAQLGGLAIGGVGDILGVIAGLPAWTNIFTTDKTFNDGIKALFGTTPGTDAEIYYDGADFVIDVNSGDVLWTIAGGNLTFQQATTVETSTGALTLQSGDSHVLIIAAADAQVRVGGTLCQLSEIDFGNSGAADTIDWRDGNFARSRLTAAVVTYTFIDPINPADLIIRLVQDGVGGRTAVWPATVFWAGGAAPVLSVGVNALDVMRFYHDGTNYNGSFELDVR